MRGLHKPQKVRNGPDDLAVLTDEEVASHSTTNHRRITTRGAKEQAS
jgi:hypothetical protein